MAGSAQAEVRSKTVQDPADSQPPLSGLPTTPDIKQVQVSYDTAGSFSFAIDFYHTIDALNLSSNYTQYGDFELGFVCDGQQSRRYVQGFHHIVGSPQIVNQYSVSGFTGTAPVARVVSNGGTRITISGSAPQLAGQDYTCFSYRTAARTRSSASNPSSDYDPACGCWYLDGGTDFLKGSDPVLRLVYFDGYEPKPLACFNARLKLRRLKYRLRQVKRDLKAAKRVGASRAKIRKLKRRAAKARGKVRKQKAVMAEACPQR